jgi:hypothetical protein
MQKARRSRFVPTDIDDSAGTFFSEVVLDSMKYIKCDMCLQPIQPTRDGVVAHFRVANRYTSIFLHQLRRTPLDTWRPSSIMRHAE